MEQINQIVEAIEKCSLLELSELQSALADKFGTYQSGIIIGTQPQVSKQAVEEKTEFNVVLVSFGNKKIEVIKTVRAMTQLGLKEAKALVDSVPVTIMESVSKSDAEEFRSDLEGVGATVSLE